MAFLYFIAEASVTYVVMNSNFEDKHKIVYSAIVGLGVVLLTINSCL